MLNDHMSVFLKVTQWFFMIVLGLQRNPLTFIFLLRFVLRSAANSLLVSGESRLTQKKHHCWHCSACFFLWIQLLPSHAGRYDHPAAERTWPVAARANFFFPGSEGECIGVGWTNFGSERHMLRKSFFARTIFSERFGSKGSCLWNHDSGAKLEGGLYANFWLFTIN